MLEIALRYGLNAQASMTAPARLRRWFMPFGTAALMLADFYWGGLNGPTATAIASALILLCGVPHGTLDVEIAATLSLIHI